jgi:uncharacterized protein (DUF983 family)
VSGGRSAISPLAAALRGRCPRCGKGRLFNGVLTVTRSCAVCGLDLAAEDAGDGPAVFVVLVLGAIVVTGAVLVEIVASPPLWVHALLWPPVILGGSLLLLRPLKAGLIALQYRHHLLGDAPR